MSNTRSNKSSEDNCGDRSNVSKTIVKQGIGGIFGYCANGPMVVSLPMSKTRLNLVSEDKWGDCSNVSKKIEK